MNALIRRSRPEAPSGKAKTITASAIEPLEIRYFTPLSRNTPPSRRYVHVPSSGFEPASGSVSPKASRHRPAHDSVR